MHAIANLSRGETLEVTWNVIQEDIDAGERMDCWRCPIALSVEREFPGLLPEVDPVEITLYEKNESGDQGLQVATGRTPEIGKRFISYFDEDEPVEPITLTVTFTRC